MLKKIQYTDTKTTYLYSLDFVCPQQTLFFEKHNSGPNPFTEAHTRFRVHYYECPAWPRLVSAINNGKYNDQYNLQHVDIDLVQLPLFKRQ